MGLVNFDTNLGTPYTRAAGAPTPRGGPTPANCPAHPLSRVLWPALDTLRRKGCGAAAYLWHRQVLNLCVCDHVTRVGVCGRVCVYAHFLILKKICTIRNKECLLRIVIFLHNACQGWGVCPMLVTSDQTEPTRSQAHPASGRSHAITC